LGYFSQFVTEALFTLKRKEAQMRISDDRYSRDRQRLDLALRFIQHEARTRTIRLWTGLSDDRIRKLYRSYVAAGSSVPRHRGKSPQQAAFFTRNAQLRHETAVLTSVCYLFGVLPSSRLADLQRTPGSRRAEARISFEHMIFLIAALARGEELRADHCSHCQCLIVIDRLRSGRSACLSCEETQQECLDLRH
jgi:hypothetical protein